LSREIKKGRRKNVAKPRCEFCGSKMRTKWPGSNGVVPDVLACIKCHATCLSNDKRKGGWNWQKLYEGK